MKRTVMAWLCLCLMSIGCHKDPLGQIRQSDGQPISVPTPGFSAEPEETVFVAKELLVDKRYPSMKGPANTDLVALLPNSDDLAWITGFKATIVKEDGKTEQSQDYMCHTNLDIVSPDKHVQQDPQARFNSGRLFTISQGQQEADFPAGFGVPMRLGTPLEVAVQALNLGEVPDSPFMVRHRVVFKWVADESLKEPLKPLFVMSAVGLKALDGETTHYGVDNSEMPEGGGCLVGDSADDKGVFRDEHDNPFTAHWVVKPGLEENHTVVTEMMRPPYNTTIHYVLAHVHPYCESVELRDTTVNETVLKLEMKQHGDRIGLSHTEHYSSPQGLPIFKDHEYELISIYNNTSGEDQDSMAVMLLYMLDKEFMARSPEKRNKPPVIPNKSG